MKRLLAVLPLLAACGGAESGRPATVRPAKELHRLEDREAEAPDAWPLPEAEDSAKEVYLPKRTPPERVEEFVIDDPPETGDDEATED